MENIIKTLKDTPIPTVLVWAGLFFILLTFVSKIGGMIEVQPNQKKLTLFVGLFLLSVGIVLNIYSIKPNTKKPAPPTIPNEKAIIYTDDHFTGSSVELPIGEYNYGTIPNDLITSLKVPNNLKVTLFNDVNFQGLNKTFPPGNHSYIGDKFNDKVSSIKVERAEPQS